MKNCVEDECDFLFLFLGFGVGGWGGGGEVGRFSLAQNSAKIYLLISVTCGTLVAA